MEVPSGQEEEIPIPLNISYGGGQHGHAHMIHHHHHHQPPHNHIMASSVGGGGGGAAGPQIPTNGAAPLAAVEDLHHQHHFKKLVKYRECLKNHAAAMGGNATDGCGEFMPSGEEGSIEALTCSACSCHRNFHRKEVEGEITSNPCETCFHTVNPRIGVGGRKLFMGHPQAIGYHGGTLISARAVAPHQMIMPYSVGASLPSESEDQDDGGGGGMSGGRPSQLAKKRFRTKFTQEQKDKMLSFAEKVGWKIQKQEEGVVQQFCQEVGVKRRVLKVWMHNNKHSLSSKKNPEPNPDQNHV